MDIDGTAFHENGFLHIEGCLDITTLDRLREEVLRITATAQSSSTASPSCGPTLHNILSVQPSSAAIDGRLSLHIQHAFRFSPWIRELIHDPRLARPVYTVCGRDLRLLDDQLYWKPAALGGATYVHRDSDFFGPLEVITAWLPLNDVDETNGCLWAVPGSHRTERTSPGLKKRTAQLQGVPSDKRPFDFFYEVDWPAAGFLPLCMRAGDVLLIHRHVLHCSLEVRGTRERLSYLVEYVAAEDADRYRMECSGLFDYHDRWQDMDLIRQDAMETKAEGGELR